MSRKNQTHEISVFVHVHVCSGTIACICKFEPQNLMLEDRLFVKIEPLKISRYGIVK